MPASATRRASSVRRHTSPGSGRRSSDIITQEAAVSAAQQDVIRAQQHLARLDHRHNAAALWSVQVPEEDVSSLLAQQAGLIQTLVEQQHQAVARERRGRSPVRRGLETLGRVALQMVGVNVAQAQEAAELQRESVHALRAVLQDPRASNELKMHVSTQLAEHAKLAHASIGGAMRLPMCLLGLALLIVLLYDGWHHSLMHARSFVSRQWGAPQSADQGRHQHAG
jgi:hypothetical protein